MDEPQLRPFRPLGKRLKALRDRANETLAEASGAVEIDVKLLASYELGHARPSEDILLLLISHFSAKDEEAVQMWEMAGYGMRQLASSTPDNGEQPVMFTDVVDVIVNNYGVVMHFMQSSGLDSQPATVSKVGMSREHAKSVLQILQTTLAQTEKNIPRLPRKIISPDNLSPDDLQDN